MKLAKLITVAALGIVLSGGLIGCKNQEKELTSYEREVISLKCDSLLNSLIELHDSNKTLVNVIKSEDSRSSKSVSVSLNKERMRVLEYSVKEQLKSVESIKKICSLTSSERQTLLDIESKSKELHIKILKGTA